MVDEAAVVVVVMMESTRVLVKVICALAVLELAAAELDMDVEYPDMPINRSRVMLTCRNGLRPLSGAQFEKDGVPLAPGQANNQVISLTNEGDGEVTFTFTQAQEGNFRCAGGGEMSDPIGLTGNDIGCAFCSLHVYVDMSCTCSYVLYTSLTLHSIQLYQKIPTCRRQVATSFFQIVTVLETLNYHAPLDQLHWIATTE